MKAFGIVFYQNFQNDQASQVAVASPRIRNFCVYSIYASNTQVFLPSMSVLGDGDASPSSNNCSFMEYLSPFLLKMTDKESSETNIHTAMYPGHGTILYSENNIQGNKIYSINFATLQVSIHNRNDDRFNI